MSSHKQVTAEVTISLAKKMTFKVLSIQQLVYILKTFMCWSFYG